MIKLTTQQLPNLCYVQTISLLSITKRVNIYKDLCTSIRCSGIFKYIIKNPIINYFSAQVHFTNFISLALEYVEKYYKIFEDNLMQDSTHFMHSFPRGIV